MIDFSFYKWMDENDKNKPLVKWEKHELVSEILRELRKKFPGWTDEELRAAFFNEQYR